MKKAISVFGVLLLALCIIGASSKPASAATVQTYTVHFGNGYTIINSSDVGGFFGFAPLSTTVYFTTNQYGLAIDSVTQKQSALFPYKATNLGTKIISRASHSQNEYAIGIGNFNVKFFRLPYNLSYFSSRDYTLKTSINVIKIDKAKQTLTFSVSRSVY